MICAFCGKPTEGKHVFVRFSDTRLLVCHTCVAKKLKPLARKFFLAWPELKKWTTALRRLRAST